MAVLSRLSVKLWSQLEEENVSFFLLALISVLGFRKGFQSAGVAPLAVKSFKTCYILLFFFLYTQFCFFVNILEVSLEESYHLTKLDWLIVCARAQKKKQNLQNNSREAQQAVRYSPSQTQFVSKWNAKTCTWLVWIAGGGARSLLGCRRNRSSDKALSGDDQKSFFCVCFGCLK